MAHSKGPKTAFPANMTTMSGLEAESAKQLICQDSLSLIILAGPNMGQSFALKNGVTVIGRDDTVDIQILDGGVSRRHATVSKEATGCFLRDTNSRNGTRLNDEPITAAARLELGDKIQLGQNVVLRFSHSDELETQYAQKMYRAGLRDGLTGTYNRRYLEQRLVAEVSFALRHHAALSVLMLDIDHFKSINDTHGHSVGDDVLRQVATCVSQTVRTEDVLARYGGEEFAIICRGTPSNQATVLAERVRKGVAELQIASNEQTLAVTVSVGVADLTVDTQMDGRKLIQAADKALYEAKRSGRNRVSIAAGID